MKQTKKILSAFLALIMIISIIPMSVFTVSAEDSATSGTCGENLIWTFDESTGTLTISGTGEMEDCDYDNRPWEDYEDSIKTVVIEDGVTSIGDCAFQDCTSLTGITLPDSALSIGSYAFDYCENLECVIIPDSVTFIGSFAFSSCVSLIDLTIPDSVTSIGNSAFSNCTSLVNAIIGENVTTIGSGIFFSCKKLETVSLGSNITSISNDAFQSCYNLTNITIPDSVTSIGNDAFRGCTSLTSVTIPDSVTSIGNSAFSNCTNLARVTIGNGVTSIGFSAFEDCTSLTEITFGNNVALIGESAFKNCTSLEEINITSISMWCNITFSDIYSNPIHCAELLLNGEKIISLEIPNGVTTISDYAFYKCTSLINVTLPDSVTSIGNGAFLNCTNLARVTIGNSVTSIGFSAFEDCTSLTEITFGNNVTIIGEWAFCNCTSLASITIPDSITTIGDYAFGDCENLTNIAVDINNKFYSSDEYGVLFNKNKTTLIKYPCGNIRESYEIPNTVTTIEESSFVLSENLRNVIITDNVTSIGHSAFLYCNGLTNVNLPESIEIIGGWAFRWCENLTNITIGTNVKSVGIDAFTGTAFFNNLDNWEDGVLYIDKYLIAEKILPGGYTIKSDTKIIGDYAFYWCENLYNITIPNSVITIGNSAFLECYNLTDVYYLGTEDEWNKMSIDDYNEPLLNATIHFLGEETHECSYVSIVTPPTCTEQGYTTYTCECGESYIDNYTEALGHKSVAVEVIPATCQQEGKQYDMCETCGVSLTNIVTVPKRDHTLGNWEIVNEATSTTEGKKIRKCTACGTVVVEEIIPATGNDDLGYATDNNTGVSVEFPMSEYNGEVGINVEEVVNDSESIFQLVNSDGNVVKSKPYDITMTLDGNEIQPNGEITVKIPLPEGYNPELSLVKHIDLVTGAVEDIESEFIDGYLVFKTNHFSIYVIVEEYNYTFTIQEPSRTEIRNKDGIILHANVEGTAPNGSYVRWEASNGNFDKSADGSNLKIVAKNKGWTTFTAILCDADGNELARDTVDMYSKSGFFDKIGGFFRSLFGTTKVYEN